MYGIDDARQLSKKDLDTLANIKVDTKPSKVLDKLDAIDIICKADTPPSQELIALDKENQRLESASFGTLRDNTFLMGLESQSLDDILKQDGKNPKTMMDLAKYVVENTDTIKDMYRKHIKDMQGILQNTSVEVVNKLPMVELYEKGEDDKPKVMMSMNDERQLNTNVQLIGIDDKTVKDLSLTSLIAIS